VGEWTCTAARHTLNLFAGVKCGGGVHHDRIAAVSQDHTIPGQSCWGGGCLGLGARSMIAFGISQQLTCLRVRRIPSDR
jgi:hypothetical protein